MTTRNCLLTGASGVVGSALLPKLNGHQVVSLTHSAHVRGEQVRGNLTQPLLGLDPCTHRMLAEQVDTVVHVAALTDFSASDEATADLNVEGTRRILDFAAEADARVLYVSTAFVARESLGQRSRGADLGEASASPSAYLDSKRRAEELVHSSGLAAAIARLAVVIGDTGSGEITRFQGLHQLIKALLRDQLPIVPLDPDARIDIVPRDVVADALAAIVDAGVPRGEYWLTAGAAAPTARTVLEESRQIAADLKISFELPRFVSAEMVSRLLRPVFIDPLPLQARRRFDELMAMTALFTDADPFPTSLGSIPNGPGELTERALRDALATSIRYLCEASGMIPPPRAAEAAA